MHLDILIKYLPFIIDVCQKLCDSLGGVYYQPFLSTSHVAVDNICIDTRQTVTDSRKMT